MKWWVVCMVVLYCLLQTATRAEIMDEQDAHTFSLEQLSTELQPSGLQPSMTDPPSTEKSKLTFDLNPPSLQERLFGGLNMKVDLPNKSDSTSSIPSNFSITDPYFDASNSTAKETKPIAFRNAYLEQNVTTVNRTELPPPPPASFKPGFVVAASAARQVTGDDGFLVCGSDELCVKSQGFMLPQLSEYKLKPFPDSIRKPDTVPGSGRRAVAWGKHYALEDTTKPGMNLLVLDRTREHNKIYERTFSTHVNSTESDELAGALRSYKENVLMVITTAGAWEGSVTDALLMALKQIGGNDISFWKGGRRGTGVPYVLVGRPGLCEGHGTDFIDGVNYQSSIQTPLMAEVKIKLEKDNRFSSTAPTITQVTPSRGIVLGGDVVMIDGYNLGRAIGDVLDISIRGVKCRDVRWLNSKLVSCVTGDATKVSGGLGDVIVYTRQSGNSPSCCNYFEYSFEPILSLDGDVQTVHVDITKSSEKQQNAATIPDGADIQSQQPVEQQQQQQQQQGADRHPPCRKRAGRRKRCCCDQESPQPCQSQASCSSNSADGWSSGSKGGLRDTEPQTDPKPEYITVGDTNAHETDVDLVTENPVSAFTIDNPAYAEKTHSLVTDALSSPDAKVSENELESMIAGIAVGGADVPAGAISALQEAAMDQELDGANRKGLGGLSIGGSEANLASKARVQGVSNPSVMVPATERTSSQGSTTDSSDNNNNINNNGGGRKGDRGSNHGGNNANEDQDNVNGPGRGAGGSGHGDEDEALNDDDGSHNNNGNGRGGKGAGAFPQDGSPNNLRGYGKEPGDVGSFENAASLNHADCDKDDTCSRITRVIPSTGPIEGGTRLFIFTDRDATFTNINKITVRNIPCHSWVPETSPTGVSCVTGDSRRYGPGWGPVTICYWNRCETNPNVMFYYESRPPVIMNIPTPIPAPFAVNMPYPVRQTIRQPVPIVVPIGTNDEMEGGAAACIALGTCSP